MSYEGVSVRLPRELIRRIEEWGKPYGLNLSDSIKAMIILFLEVGCNAREG